MFLTDEYFMKEALKEAFFAFEKGDLLLIMIYENKK